MTHPDYEQEAIALLQALIATPRQSRDEAQAAAVLRRFLDNCGLSWHAHGHNTWCIDPQPDASRPTLLLNAHIDTVRPAASWTRNPYAPDIEGDRLYGLGSNDCGAGLVCLLQTYRRAIASPHRAYNLIYLASAEEEVSGSGGIEAVLPLLPPIDVALVGEPTGLRPAIAERGLMVLDLISHGRSGHAARREGVNAIYEMLDDLQWIRSYRFGKISPLLGPTTMSLTVIHAGTQHNMVPDRCEALIDVRVNELYTNEEVFDLLRRHLRSELKAHSFRLRSSHIDAGHPLIQRCLALGLTPFGSPTLSDQALLRCPSFKFGPGDSARSHTADEYIMLSEIRRGLDLYAQLLEI